MNRVRETSTRHSDLTRKRKEKRLLSLPSHGTRRRVKKLRAPIFNTEFAGKPLKYIRPLDPVWPVEQD